MNCNIVYSVVIALLWWLFAINMPIMDRKIAFGLVGVGLFESVIKLLDFKVLSNKITKV